jgi:hypothetical protein
MLSRAASSTAKFARPSTVAVRRTLARSVATQANNSKNGGDGRSSSFFGIEVFMALGLSVATATGVTMLDAPKNQLGHPSQPRLQQIHVPHYPQPKEIQVDQLSPSTIPARPRLNEPPSRPDLPTYTREEVAEHCDEDSLWYTFRGAVYDLTFFYKGHPGGSTVRSLQTFIYHLYY